MGKVAGKTEAVSPSVSEAFFCPFQSSANVPVYCDLGCALHIVRRRVFGGRVVFSGCCLKWLALMSDYE